MSQGLPLDGFTVVAIEQAVAAPLATRNLADLGARVIKVERVDGGDLARGYDHVVEGISAHFVWLNRGKESIAVDLKTAEGRTAVGRLIDRADVFLQNLAPGAADRIGLGANELRDRRPELIVVNISGYGTGGELEQRKAYDMLIQAEAGLISITGAPDAPAKTGVPTADIASGMYAAQSVVAALLRRVRTGSGATIDVSMLEATLEWMGAALYTQMYTGSPPPRMGLSHTAIAPYNAYPTADGQILIGVQSDSGWRTLVTKVLGVPSLAEDPRLVTNVDRARNRALCDGLVAEQTRRFTTEDLDRRLADAGVPAAQVNALDRVVNHPQLQSRDRWRTVRTESAVVPALLPPATFRDTEAAMGDVPALGEHTRNLLLEAGLSEVDADDMLDRRIALQANTITSTAAC
jgi:crotonobetainyl-CoA:carnitine CoA-transferase CaiB-like acyl-CoA transferase